MFMINVKMTTQLFQSIQTVKKHAFLHSYHWLELDAIFSLLFKAETHINVRVVNYQVMLFVKLTLIHLDLFQIHQLTYLDPSKHVLNNILVQQVT